ncbi:hypothetical protein [Paenibacillus cremeus]|uniref:Acid shock protein n=1 Tax=Paenibacillus cremeus TaxID=2163881 RepID=A0A559K5U0_9BACL|nr:hypothetical protein [Paenibacillus cremeus]TVY07463.1 hypothetical protein FPZ49_23525 [Paenibacillus cremeus]
MMNKAKKIIAAGVVFSALTVGAASAYAAPAAGSYKHSQKATVQHSTHKTSTPVSKTSHTKTVEKKQKVKQTKTSKQVKPVRQIKSSKQSKTNTQN